MRPLLSLSALVLLVSSCDSGDYLGPVERGAREAFNGWDFWATDMVRPYEDPVPGMPEGVVPMSGRSTYETGASEYYGLAPAVRERRSFEAYRRFCYHCHGAHGDGRIIVGESFTPAPPDLRSREVQARSDRMLYGLVADGTGNMIPLKGSVSSLDIVLALAYVRTLKNAPSRPYFRPKNVRPLE